MLTSIFIYLFICWTSSSDLISVSTSTSSLAFLSYSHVYHCNWKPSDIPYECFKIADVFQDKCAVYSFILELFSDRIYCDKSIVPNYQQQINFNIFYFNTHKLCAPCCISLLKLPNFFFSSIMSYSAPFLLLDIAWVGHFQVYFPVLYQVATSMSDLECSPRGLLTARENVKRNCILILTQMIKKKQCQH